MANLQVKGLNDALYQALRARAALDHRSISQEIVMLIHNFLNYAGKSSREATEAFLALTGSWQDERSAAEIARDLRKSRRNKKCNGNFGHVSP